MDLITSFANPTIESCLLGSVGAGVWNSCLCTFGSNLTDLGGVMIILGRSKVLVSGESGVKVCVSELPPLSGSVSVLSPVSTLVGSSLILILI